MTAAMPIALTTATPSPSDDKGSCGWSAKVSARRPAAGRLARQQLCREIGFACARGLTGVSDGGSQEVASQEGRPSSSHAFTSPATYEAPTMFGPIVVRHHLS
jgi:hypothetical protein